MSAAMDAPAAGSRGGLKSWFVLEGLNALATAYYFNYLFFYLERNFGFGNRKNLLVTALYGFVYMFSAWFAGRIAKKHGYVKMLSIGFAGMCLAMSIGGLNTHLFHDHAIAEAMEFVLLVLWTCSMCFTWPTLQALVSKGRRPADLPRIAGIYNVVWATGSAFAYLTGGALMDRLGSEALVFWVPAGLHLTQLAVIAGASRTEGTSAANAEAAPREVQGEMTPDFNPRPIAKGRVFLTLAWIANPFAYVAIYGILPVIPKLAERLGLNATNAGLVCSVWFWARLGAFVWFWLWPGWRYRFNWLLGAFIASIAGFAAILLSPNVAILVAAQIGFGLAVGLVYYSSLYYSMDTGASESEHGGVHEAAIGAGIFLGPAAGVAGLYLFPASPNAGTYDISLLLVLGLCIFLFARRRAQPARLSGN